MPCQNPLFKEVTIETNSTINRNNFLHPSSPMKSTKKYKTSNQKVK